MKLSVVIPTLGGIELKDTIKTLQNSSIRPMEILICIPNSSELLAEIDLSDNVEIIRTKRKGQVYQRCQGCIRRWVENSLLVLVVGVIMGWRKG